MSEHDETLLTPSQLNSLARSALEDLFGGVRVEGEIGNLARPASGHLYFTLKDDRAQIRCALFKTRSPRLDFQPKDGARVIVHGRVSLYEPRGDYQLIADGMVLAGEGELRRQLEQLRQKLQLEGLFDASRKRPLPRYVRRLGVITSPSGAAIRDVISVIERRFPLLAVEILPVPVQGTTAPPQIVETLRWADRSGRYDALLLTRGGGSLEDLWAFNDEMLVRQIAALETPIVSAVGHESDTTLADFAADVRAATPSAAAELLTPMARDLQVRLDSAWRRLAQRHLHVAGMGGRHLEQLQRRLAALAPSARLLGMRERARAAMFRLAALHRSQARQRAEHLRNVRARFDACHPALPVRLARQRQQAAVARLNRAYEALATQRQARLHGLVRTLHAMSPLATVDRGFSLLQNHEGRLIRSVSQVEPGDALKARVADGEIALRVTGKESPP